MSHHASGPNFGFPRGDAWLDMTDLYAFPKPGQPDRSVLVLNVHPSFAVNPLGPTTKEPFAPGALYEIKIDTDGDAEARLRESERSLRQLTETIPVMLWSATPEGAIDDCSARFLEYTGFSRCHAHSRREDTLPRWRRSDRTSVSATTPDIH